MAAETTNQGENSALEKFRAHSIQNDWLNQANEKSVEITLEGGHVLYGVLTGHDSYCLALDEASQKVETLIYKRSISFISFSKSKY